MKFTETEFKVYNLHYKVECVKVVGLEKINLTKIDKNANPPRGDGVWVLGTPLLSFNVFYK